jgi:hypothetical protein
VARTEEVRDAYRILEGTPFGKPRIRWENNIKIDVMEISCEDRDQWRFGPSENAENYFLFCLMCRAIKGILKKFHHILFLKECFANLLWLRVGSVIVSEN